MTIKTRNRFIKVLFGLSTIHFIFCLAIFLISYFTKSLNFEIFNQYIKPAPFIFQYNPYCVLASLMFLIFYVCTISYIIFRSFEKTPATEPIYIVLFLISCLASSVRIIIGLLNISDTFSNLLVVCGHIFVFSRILFPVSMLCVCMMPIIEQKQDTDRNFFIIFMICLFTGCIIPLNTLKSLPNFATGYSCRNIINITEIIILIIATIILFVNNRRRLFNQKTTIGFALTYVGLTMIFNTTNLFQLIFGIVILIPATYLYYSELHKQFLWND